MTNTNQTTITVVRLHPDIYKKLEQKFSKTNVNENTTAFLAGYSLGIETILKEIRNGLTYEVQDAPISQA